MSTNVLLEKVKQQEEKIMKYKHYEKYLQMSPNIPTTNQTSPIYNINDTSASNIDELLRDFKKELNSMKNTLDGPSNYYEHDNLKKIRFDKTPDALKPSENTPIVNSSFKLDDFFPVNTIGNSDAQDYLSKNSEGLLKGLDFSLDQNIPRPSTIYDNMLKSPFIQNTRMNEISPSPFTKLKRADIQDFLFSPITRKKEEPPKDKQEELELKEKTEDLLELEENTNAVKRQISSSAEVALKLENLQLRNEVSKLSAAVAAIQARMRDLESHMDQILNIVTKKHSL
jgi:hypothetical protein